MIKIRKALALCFALAALGSPAQSFAQTGPANLNVSGVLYLPNGTLLSQNPVHFRLEVWDKSNSCILYSEEHLAQDLSSTKGAFSLPLGKGSSPTNYLESTSFFTTKIFENSGAVAGGWPNCPSGATLNSGDERTVHVAYNLGAGYVAMTPDVPIASSAFAMVADTLQGKRPADLVQINVDGSHALSQANVEDVFSTSNFARLQQLLNPTAALSFGSQRLTNISDPSSAQDAATKNYTDSKLAGQTIDLQDVAPGFGGGKVLTWDQAANKWVAQAPTIAGSAGGDLTGSYPSPTIAASAIGTSKLADNAVTSAKINSAGIATNRLLITDSSTGATVTYANCANDEILKYVTGTGWQCATVSSLSAVTSVAGKTGAVTLNALDISGLGTAAVQNVGIGATEIPQLNGSGRLANSTIPLFLGDVTGAIDANVVTALQGRPLASTLPNTDEVLRWNGSRWEPQALTDNGITALTGDISASGNGSVGATLTNGVVTTPKLFTNPGINRLVATDNSSGANLVPFVCNLNETMQWTASGWACTTVNTLLGTQFIVDGGNARGANISIGTSDNYNLDLKTNDQSRITVSNSGAVGIGITNPTFPLEVAGTAGSQPLRLIADPTGGRGVLLTTTDYAGATTGSSLRLDLGAPTGTTFARINATTAGAISPGVLVLNSTGGNVGIGTTSPNTLLDVNGVTNSSSLTIAGKNALFSSGGYLQINNTGSAQGVQIFPGSSASAAFTLANGTGFIGIGSTSPSAKLDIYGGTANISNPGANATMSFTDGTVAGYGGVLSGSGYYAGTTSNHPLVLFTDNTEKFRISSTGNIGIGTTAPARLLDIAGAMRMAPSIPSGSPLSGEMLIDSTAGNSLKYHNGTSWVAVGAGTGDFMASGSVPMTGNLRLNDNWLSGDGGHEGVFVSSTGNVGIGTSSPAYPLDVNGIGRFMDTISIYKSGSGSQLTLVDGDNTRYWNVGTNFSGGAFTIRDTSAAGAPYRFLIDTSGKVGIGTTTPGQTLDVRGSLRLANDDLVPSSTGTFVDFGLGAATGNTYAQIQGYTNGGINPASVALNPVSGNVGIGISIPTATLNVSGPNGNAGSGNPLLRLSDTTSGHYLAADSGSIGSGLRLISSGNLELQAASSASQLVLASNGNVGFGTGSPNRILEVNGVMRLSPAANPASPAAGDLYIDSAAANALKYHDGSTWVTVGSGTGDFLKNGSVAMTGNIRLNNNWLSGDGGNEGLSVDSSGRVGIGTSAPSALLHVKGAAPQIYVQDSASTNAQVARTANIKFYDSANSPFGYVGDGSSGTNSMDLGTLVAEPVRILTDSNEALRIASDGKVGIGTTSPSRLLEVNGVMKLNPGPNPASPTAGDIYVDSGAANSLKYHNGTSWVAVGAGTGDFMASGSVPMTGNLRLNGNWLSGDGGNEGIFVDSAGSVGIGTTNPTQKLDVAGYMNFSDASSNSVIYGSGRQWLTMGASGTTYINSSGAATAIALQPNGATAMNLLANGNIGIGTSAPGSKLSVVASAAGVPPIVAYQTDGTTMNARLGSWNGDAGGLALYNGAGTLQSVISANSSDSTYFNAGNVGIGTSNPSDTLTVSAGNIVATGTYGSSPSISLSGAGTKMIWYPRKGSFRAGNVSGTQWDDASIGDYSAAFNQDSTASGLYTTALGRSTASGQYAFSAGNGTASGNYSSAFGTLSSASADYSFATGVSTSASGYASIASGVGTFAGSYGQAAFGSYSINLGGTVGSWVSSDPLFVIGNGTGSGARSNAVTILKNGNVGIGITGPTRLLDVAGPIRILPASLPTSPAAGELAFDANASNALKYHDGSNWVSVGSGSGDFMADGSVSMTGNLRLNNKWLSGDGDNEGVFVDSTGKVGVGTTSPNSTFDVTVNSGSAGGMAINNFSAGSQFVGRVAGGASGSPAQLSSSLNVAAFIAQGLDETSTYRSIGNISITNDSAVTSTSSSGNMKFSTTSSGSVTPSEKMRISAAGNVGIATSSPGRLLHVAGAMRLSATSSPSSPAAGDIFVDSGSANALKYHNGTNWVSVGSGTGDLMADGSIPMTGNLRLNNHWLSGDGGNEGIYVDSSGNVGIGTTSPAAKLDVNGEARIGNTSLGCSASTEGAMRYNSTSKVVEFCNGTAWAGVNTSVPAGTICGMRQAYCTSSTISYDWQSSGATCQGNTLTGTCNASQLITAVSGCPSGYSGKWAWTAKQGDDSYQLFCVKN